MSSTLNDTIDLETTAEILDRIAGGKEAYEELPNNGKLETTAEILDSICESDLDEILDKLERISALRKELGV
jgi:hypothetical protein